MGSRATLVLVIYYLRSLQRLAEAALDQISAILGAFEVEVCIHQFGLSAPFNLIM
jgi:hypothetical protein